MKLGSATDPSLKILIMEEFGFELDHDKSKTNRPTTDHIKTSRESTTTGGKNHMDQHSTKKKKYKKNTNWMRVFFWIPPPHRRWAARRCLCPQKRPPAAAAARGCCSWAPQPAPRCRMQASYWDFSTGCKCTTGTSYDSSLDAVSVVLPRREPFFLPFVQP